MSDPIKSRHVRSSHVKSNQIKPIRVVVDDLIVEQEEFEFPENPTSQKYEVEIKGITPLLVSNPLGMMKLTSKQIKALSPQQLAELQLYRTKRGVCMPTKNLRAGIIEGASLIPYKGRSSCKKICQETITIRPINNNKQINMDDKWQVYETIKHTANGLLKVAFPMWKNWGLKFVLEVDTDELNPTQLKACVEAGGERKGLGANRVDKFGRFNVVSFTRIER